MDRTSLFLSFLVVVTLAFTLPAYTQESLTYDRTSQPRLQFECAPNENRIELALFNDFGGRVMSLNQEVKRNNNGMCRTSKLGELIQPPLKVRPCPPPSRPGRTPICDRSAPKYRGLAVGKYSARIRVLDASGKARTLEVPFTVEPLVSVNFADGIEDVEAFRGNWREGLSGVEVAGVPDLSRKPLYARVTDASVNRLDWSYVSTTTHFSVLCADPSCEAGQAIYVARRGQTNNIVRYGSIVASINGLGQFRLHSIQERPTGIVESTIFGPVDVSAYANDGIYRLRTELFHRSTGAISVYLNDNLIACHNYRGPNISPNGNSGLFFRSNSENDIAEFISHSAKQSQRTHFSCYYQM